MINEIETSFWKDKLNWKIFIILWKKEKDKVRNESVTNLILFASGAASQMLTESLTQQFAAIGGLIHKAANGGNWRIRLISASPKPRGWDIYKIKNKEARQSGPWGAGERWLEKVWWLSFCTGLTKPEASARAKRSPLVASDGGVLEPSDVKM